MAIDTAAKRLSAMNVGEVTGWGCVYPTGVIDQAARQDVVGIYRGILAAAPVIMGYIETLIGTTIFTRALTGRTDLAAETTGETGLVRELIGGSRI